MDVTPEYLIDVLLQKIGRAPYDFFTTDLDRDWFDMNIANDGPVFRVGSYIIGIVEKDEKECVECGDVMGPMHYSWGDWYCGNCYDDEEE